jgi:hypothetical protein
MKYLAIFLITALISSCTLIPDLTRDNPFDAEGESYNLLPKITYSHYKILDTQNWYSDKIIPGATVAINFVFQNTSNFDAKNVIADYVIDETNIEVSEKNSVIGDIYANNLSVEKANIVFTINENAITGIEIPLDISLKDEAGNSWQFKISLIID